MPDNYNYQTYQIDCSKRMESPYLFLGHIVEGQGQSDCFDPSVVPQYRYLIIPELDRYQIQYSGNYHTRVGLDVESLKIIYYPLYT